MKEQDLTVAGEGSPISLKKFIQGHQFDGKNFTVLLDQTSSGFMNDDPGTVTIDEETISMTAIQYLQTFDNKRISFFLVRHLHYMQFGDLEIYKKDVTQCSDYFSKDPKGKEEYEKLLNMITYMKHNKESRHLVGLITCLSGVLNLARKEGKPIKVYLEHPESHLHPQKEARLMSMLYKLYEEYNEPIDTNP